MHLEDIEMTPPGPGEARVRHHAIGVNFLDIYYRTGLYPVPAKPFTPGNEGAGEIVAVGEGVTQFKPGDRVAYVAPIGSYAEERNVEARFLLKLPEPISYETAAAMMLKGLTAQYLLRQTYEVKAGDTILVHAAAGGVGLILCQWAKALGAIVIGTVGSAEKAELAKKAGAEHLILYREEDFAARVNEITKGAKCAVVYDSIGKATFPASLDCLRPFGTFASYGSARGRSRGSAWRFWGRRDRCSRRGRRFLRSWPTGSGWRAWRATCSASWRRATLRSASPRACRSPRRRAPNRRWRGGKPPARQFSCPDRSRGIQRLRHSFPIRKCLWIDSISLG